MYFTYTYICMCIYICTYKYEYIYIYIYIYIYGVATHLDQSVKTTCHCRNTAFCQWNNIGRFRGRGLQHGGFAQGIGGLV